MALSEPVPPPFRGLERRYLRPPVPLHFPVEDRVPEDGWHFLGRARLFESVRLALAGRGLVSSDQFVYWDPTDPRECLAPDLAIRIGTPAALIKTWKTWQLGAPHVAVELVSSSDPTSESFERQLERYRRAGILEVVRFDRDDQDRPLRLWDLIESDLVERDLTDPMAFHCDALGVYWCVHLDPELGRVLRLARGRDGSDLLPTPAEAAMKRVAELEAELAKR